MAAIDPDLVIHDVRPMPDITAATGRERFAAVLMTWFAAVATLLCAAGIFGVLAHSVAPRTREIGIRVALGATSRSVWLTLARHVGLAIFGGIVLGAFGARAMSRVLESLLFNVDATDVPTFVSVPIVMILVAIAAGFVPARRATQVHPAVVLREG